VHDGFTDVIYVLLPIWQAEFALGYAVLALLRAFYAGTMALLQLAAGTLAERFGGKLILVLGTALAGLGYAVAGSSGGIVGLCAGLIISGAGSSTQHPIASAAVARAYGKRARAPLGIYNFTGDLGKAAIPAAMSLLLVVLSWRVSLYVLAALGVATAIAIALTMPRIGRTAPDSKKTKSGGGRGGFMLLFAIAILDNGLRMGFLIFLPFLLQSKGASLPTIGTALALTFIGGAAGKAVCGWLGDRIGVFWTIVLTEGGTAAFILALLVLPLEACLALLPLLGVCLNGTSSVLYGTVPELAPSDRTERAFAIFYTGAIGSGAISPIFYGLLGDAVGQRWAIVATAVVALATIPLAFVLSPKLEKA
jgi:FSR family fosmidomycin resistance protein-like MFS transporter